MKVVHAYGTPRLIEDNSVTYGILQALVQRHEAPFEQPWTLQPLDDSMQNKLRGIVAFEIQITRLEGKFKLSQNRSANDQRRVLAALESSSDAESAGVAAFMRASPLFPFYAKDREDC